MTSQSKRQAAACPNETPQTAGLRRRDLLIAAPLAACTAAVFPLQAIAASRQDARAFGTWAAAQVSAAPADTNRINNQTVRNVVHISVGGESMRVRLSNRYGTSPLVVQAASIGVGNGNANSIANSSRALTFGGRTAFTIPAFGELFSDWVVFPVPALADLVVDIYLSADTSATTSPLTVHNIRPNGEFGAYVAAGNQTGVATFPSESSRTSWYFLAGIDVSSARVPGCIVCFGDSITDGTASTFYANGRWPDFLAQRLYYGSTVDARGVVNLGISGNRILSGNATTASTNPAALARFDSDALTQSGVSHIIVLEGINDISLGVVADRIIEGHQQMIRRAHARRLPIYGATLTPFANAPDAREAERLAVNRWIRTSGAYDAVIDFDLAVRDPANPRAMLARYDSGDTLHPNSAGYAAMAGAINLNLFTGSKVFV